LTVRSRRRAAPRYPECGQSTVELAVVLPVVVLLILVGLQAALVVRDRVLLVHATRAVGRTVIVDPTEGAARRSLAAQGPPGAQATVQLSGDRRPGELVTVRVAARPTQLPLVGRVVAGLELREQLVVMVEGPA
jgi:Flp pilus assembly protein TadG